MKGLKTHFFDKLTFTEEDFGPEASSFQPWHNYQTDISLRMTMADLVKQFKAGGEDRLQVLSALKVQVSKMSVPLCDEACEILTKVLDDDALKHAGSAGYLEHSKRYVAEHFGADSVFIPTDDTVTSMLRWAQWSTTPSFSKHCVASAQAFAYLLTHATSIRGALENPKEVTAGLCEALRHTRKIEAVGNPEVLVQCVEAMCGAHVTTGREVIPDLARNIRVWCEDLKTNLVSGLECSVDAMKKDRRGAFFGKRFVREPRPDFRTPSVDTTNMSNDARQGPLPKHEP